jgi:hypothetical protein
MRGFLEAGRSRTVAGCACRFDKRKLQVTRRTAGFHRFDDIHDRLLLDSASLIFVATQQLLMSYASHGSQVDRPDAPNESPRCHLTGEGPLWFQAVIGMLIQNRAEKVIHSGTMSYVHFPAVRCAAAR